MTLDQIIQGGIARATSRLDLWIRFVKEFAIENAAEIGVLRGDFSAAMLRECPTLKKYYMVDPWRNLKDWNKPANKDDAKFAEFLVRAKSQTDFAAGKRVILRGKTAEVIDQIPDQSLDFVYIDGDHTLKGITIDLVKCYPKLRDGGWIGGDDFSPTIWQHPLRYEPTLVFPFAVYFAEAIGAPLYALPYRQFLLRKSAESSYAFHDLTGRYHDLTLRDQCRLDKALLKKFGMKIGKLFGHK